MARKATATLLTTGQQNVVFWGLRQPTTFDIFTPSSEPEVVDKGEFQNMSMTEQDFI